MEYRLLRTLLLVPRLGLEEPDGMGSCIVNGDANWAAALPSPALEGNTPALCTTSDGAALFRDGISTERLLGRCRTDPGAEEDFAVSGDEGVSDAEENLRGASALAASFNLAPLDTSNARAECGVVCPAPCSSSESEAGPFEEGSDRTEALPSEALE